MESKYREIGEKVIILTEEKDSAYGHSLATAGDVLKLLYPNGIRPEQYRDAAVLVRMIDKMKRVATRKDAFGESPWLDICGYGLAAEVAESVDVTRIAEVTDNTDIPSPDTTKEDQYHFPGTKFVEQGNLLSQINHLNSEVEEAIHAHDSGDYDHAVEELWDFIHSAETMLRMYHELGHDVWAAKAAVEEKNRKRGYYDKEVVHAETSPA